MLERQFEKLGYFIERKYKPIIIIWVVIFLIAIPFAFESFSLVNYNVEFTGSNSNSMSQKAQNLYNEQFVNGSDSNGTAVVIFINRTLNSSLSYEIWEYFNSTYKSALKGSGYSGIISPYPIYSKFINSLGKGEYEFYDKIKNLSAEINSSYNSTIFVSRYTNSSFNNIENLDKLYKNTYIQTDYAVDSYYRLIQGYYQGLNFTAFVIYGIPLSYLKIYLQINQVYPNLSNQSKDILAKEELINYTNNFENNSLSILYFNYFYYFWNNSSGEIPDRLNGSISSAFFTTYQMLNNTEAVMFQTIYKNLTISVYNNITARKQKILNLTYELSYPYSKSEPLIFNDTFLYFENNYNISTLPFNLTLLFLNSTAYPLKSLLNETQTQFLNLMINNNITYEFVINQINQTEISSYAKRISNALGIDYMQFLNLSISGEFETIENLFIEKTSSNLRNLSNLTLLSPMSLTKNLINNTTSSLILIVESFTQRNLIYSPFAYIESFQKFFNDIVITHGNLTNIAPSNPNSIGLKVNYTLYGILVPKNFSGYTMILTFNQSSLNSSQLSIINQYLDDLQTQFPEIHVYYTGSDEIAHGLEITANDSLIRSMIIGIIISIIIVGMYFRSWKLAFIPMGFFAFSMTITLAISYIIFGMYLHSSLSFIVTTLSAILILGLSVDYSVYIMNRFFRTSSNQRVKTTVQWAGHAVFTSSIIVIISYFVMAVFNIPLIGDGGYLNSLGITITLLVALTLLPSFLHFSHREEILKHLVNFQSIAKVSRDHKYILTTVLVILLIISLITYEITPTSFDLLSLIPTNPGKIGYYTIVKDYGYDAFSNNYIVLKLPYPILIGKNFNSSDLKYLDTVEETLFESGYVKSIETVNYPFYSYVNLENINKSLPSAGILINQSKEFIGKSPDFVLINIYMKNVSFSQESINEISVIDKSLLNITESLKIDAWIGGPSQSLLDSSSFIRDSTYTIIEVLSIIIFAVLSYQLSALLTPLRLLLNVGVSTLTSVSLFYVVFYYILHYPIIVFGPLFVIVTLFGVGLDYDIFLITRTREEVFKGKNDEEAIEEALKENAGVIIALGLIISGVFGALIFSPIQIISEIGFSITVGVLFETMISWMFLIPSLMLIMKKYNWWPSKIRGDKN